MFRRIPLFVLFVLSVAAAASAQVAMLTQVSGGVRVAGSGGARDAVAFLKVNQGDTLTLTGNARVQMVYLGSGRQEVWTGAGTVQVGTVESRSSSGLTPQASQVPALVLRQLEKTPASGEHGKTGMVMLRSLDDLGAVDELEKDYADYRSKAAPGDTTPEVFLLSGLLDYQDYEKARSVLADLKTKSQTQPEYGPVVEHFTRLVDEAAAESRKR
jgi:hypothetical protein